MRSNFDAVVSALSVRVFLIPPAHVQEALDLSESTPDRSLLDTLSDLGHLRDEERLLLDELSEAFMRHETATLSGYPLNTAPSPLDTLARFRDIGEQALSEENSARTEQRYDVRHEHGRGGMGRILAVWDRRMRRDVALKELLPAEVRGGGPSSQGRVVARFLREARITGRLQHPSIIPVHEIGVRPDGTLYYTMKLVRGRTLRQAIKSAPGLEGRMALLPHYLDLCQAIAYSHAHGVIHRDIKPSNVMIGEFGETQVIDWGLAKEMDTPEEAAREEESSEVRSPELTMDGQLLGTPHYMAPEQAAGKHDELDERADVYSLGAVLYELLTGSRPYQASTGLEALRQVNSEAPAPLEQLCPEAPAALVAVCRRSMAREPGARYPSAAALADEIARFQAGARVAAHDYGVAELLARFVRRHRPVVVTVCLALTLLSGLGAYSYLSLRARHAAEHDLRVKSEQKGYDLSILIAQRAVEEYRYTEARDVLAACPVAYRDWEWGRLSLALDELQTTSLIDQFNVTEAEMTPDGHQLLTLGRDGSIKLWTLPQLELVRAYESIPEGSWSAAIHPAGNEFAVYQADGTILRQSFESMDPLASFSVDVGPGGESLAYSPDGRYLLTGAMGGKIVQWDVEGGTAVRTIAGEARLVQDLAFSPDGRWLAAAGDTGRLQVWDWASGQCVATVDAHMTNLQAGSQGALLVAFSPDSTLLASAGCDATARLWEVGTWSPRHTLAGHLKKVMGVSFSPDGLTLATHSERFVKLWDTQTGAEKPTWIRCDQGIRRAMFHPDGRHLVTAETAARVTLWDLSADGNDNYLEGHTSVVNAVRFSPDGTALASSAGHWLSGGDSRVLIWELGAEGQPLPQGPVRILEGDGRWINHLAFHPDGFWLSGADAECKFVTWDWQSGERLMELQVPAYTNGARCVAYNADGTVMATAGWGDSLPELATVDLWDTITKQRLGELTGPAKTVDHIAFSPDGQRLAAGSRDGFVHVWDVQTGAVVQKLGGDEAWVYGVAFSPDGALIAGSCGSSAVLLWDARTGALRHRLDGLQSRAEKVAFNPEGTRVAACDDGMVKVWNVETGAALLSLPHGAQDVAFSPDGRILATAGLDGRLGIWHAAPWDGG